MVTYTLRTALPLGRLFGIVALVGIFHAVRPAPAAGQLGEGAEAGAHRQGAWYGLGAGAGWDRLACEICAGDRLPGLSGYVQGGGTLSRQVQLGGEVKFWNRSSAAGVDQLLGTFGIVALWYPNVARNLQLKGGFAYLSFTADDGEDAISTTSFGPQFGIAYDIRVGPTLSVTPYASWIVTPFGDLTFNDTRVRGDVRSTLLQVGVGVLQH